ncbi:MAG: hypothetical protein R3Y47_04725 [Lachnospiraceae bacterium]
METKTSFKDLNLSNAYLFATTLADVEICKLVLETCIGKKLPDLKVAHTEHSVLMNSNFRSVRFDVYAKDVEEVSYDLEMQNKDIKELGLRSRFYQGQIDIQSILQ